MRPTYTGLPEEAEEEARGGWIGPHQWKTLAEALGVNPAKEAKFMAGLEELAERWERECPRKLSRSPS